MKQYPPIEGPKHAPNLPCIAFQKLDGSNLRWEWSRKRGWEQKFGTRKRLFDETDETFAEAIPLFFDNLADGIEKAIRDNKKTRDCERVTVFTEFYGPKSFAGQHDLEPDNNPKQIRLFDVWLYKKGLIGPRQFIKQFGHLDIPQVVYEGNLNPSFVAGVREGRYNIGQGIEEGVVCKGGSGGRDLWMRKIKTQAYLDKLVEVFREGWEKYAE